MKSRTKAALMIATIACLCASLASAQTKPDFSGAWKMNREKSKFASVGPNAILIKRKITLSADGKTITKLITHAEGGGGLVEDTVVFEKQ